MSSINYGWGNSPPIFAFLFNGPNGMCKTCEGIDRQDCYAKTLDKEKSLNDGDFILHCLAARDYAFGWSHKLHPSA